MLHCLRTHSPFPYFFMIALTATSLSFNCSLRACHPISSSCPRQKCSRKTPGGAVICVACRCPCNIIHENRWPSAAATYLTPPPLEIIAHLEPQTLLSIGKKIQCSHYLGVGQARGDFMVHGVRGLQSSHRKGNHGSVQS